MANKSVRKAIEEFLKRNKKTLWQDEIAQKLNLNFWKVAKVTEDMERKGLLQLV